MVIKFIAKDNRTWKLFTDIQHDSKTTNSIFNMNNGNTAQIPSLYISTHYNESRVLDYVTQK